MKSFTRFKLGLMAFFIPLVIQLNAQTTIWSENFNNGCSANCLLATYGNGWSVLDNVDGTSGSDPNIWYVSCAEEGVVPPGCGNSCIGDATLHIGANAGVGGDLGASFNETGAANATYRLAMSPVINTSGYSNITLSFDFIAYGSAACSDDRAQLRLSTDGGATWPAGYQYCLTSVCCGACNGYSQGQWTVYSLALPAAFNNNPNVRVAIHWINNGNGSGTDPAVAIDDISLTVPVVPLTLTDFSGRMENNKVKLSWTTEQERNVGYYAVQRSTDGKYFDNIGSLKATGNGKSQPNTYSFTDEHLPAGKLYYRLKMEDMDASFTYSPIISPAGKNAAAEVLSISAFMQKEKTIDCRLNAQNNLTVNVEVYDMQGKLISKQAGKKMEKGDNIITVNTSGIPSGVYLLNISSTDTKKDAVSITRKFVI